MPLWNGKTWCCESCNFVNAVLRRKCRNCGRQNLAASTRNVVEDAIDRSKDKTRPWPGD